MNWRLKETSRKNLLWLQQHCQSLAWKVTRYSCMHTFDNVVYDVNDCRLTFIITNEKRKLLLSTSRLKRNWKNFTKSSSRSIFLCFAIKKICCHWPNSVASWKRKNLFWLILNCTCAAATDDGPCTRSEQSERFEKEQPETVEWCGKERSSSSIFVSPLPAWKLCFDFSLFPTF